MDAQDSETARFSAMRARNEARTQRFLNARLRTIGLDTDGIERQRAERARAADEERRAEHLYQQELQKTRWMLEEREEMERRARQAEAQALREDHLARAARPKNQVPKYADPVDADATGSSAAQRFAGEDRGREQRASALKAQQKQWCDEDAARREARRAADRAETQAYHEYLMAVTKLREDAELQDAADRQRTAAEVARQNAAQARVAAERRSEERAVAEAAGRREIEALSSGAFLSEDTAQGVGADGRLRRDHWKGFSKEQAHHFLEENRRLLAEKERRRALEKQAEDAYAAQQQQVYEALSEMEHRRALEHQRAALEQREDNISRHQEAQRRRRQDRLERFGGIDNDVGFYAGFGQSCR